MAYYTLHAYDADVRIPLFAGLRQSDEIATDLRFAAEAENVETPNGILQSQAEYNVLPGSFETKIETLAYFWRRWYTGTGSKGWLIAVTDGGFYYKQIGEGFDWINIPLPQTISSIQNNVWSWITYERNVTLGETSYTVDILIMSNADDGMIIISPPDAPNIWDDVDEHDWEYWSAYTWEDLLSMKWSIQKVDTRARTETEGEEEEDNPYRNFAVIARSNDRVWGTGVPGEPDTLYYSAVYDPTDWKAYDPEGIDAPDADDPRAMEDCAGEVRQPTWNGASFTALTQFGDQLLAFKGNGVWRVMGVGPGEYTFTEQYGGGTLYPYTVAVNLDRVFLVERDGLSIYDGMTVSPFNRPYIERFWRTVNKDAMDQMCAIVYKQKYYLALPTGESEVNNALLIYDIETGTFLVYNDVYIESMTLVGDELIATSSSLPGRMLSVLYDSWETGMSSGKGSKWETPWMDFNYKTIAKGGYEIYFNPEVKGLAVTFRFTIQTEKKSKTKDVTIPPTTFQAKQKKIRFGGTGRKFKLIIEVLPHPKKAVWRLTGGIHMVVETDPD
jgi:hypothetical protein